MSKRLEGSVATVTVQGAGALEGAILSKQFFQLLHHGHGSGNPSRGMTHVAARCYISAVCISQIRDTSCIDIRH